MFSFFKKKPPVTEVEFSTNLDTKHVGPFLERVSQRIESGFGAPERKKVLAAMPAPTAEEGADFSFTVRFEGQDSVLKIAIMPDSPETVLLYLVSAPALHSMIDQEMDRFAEEVGI
ncbi:hypothetical protein Verru16b_03049 [Lacunisphaera limnophila]|uniref:Uncharacterized protein n=1 Tax=Lacunisphaera limnophila TaxID=1838286 RepID=A0A1D8AYJ5_9BACT|nr:hypothetical protein [Lacunisphaera limnophila]AOS45958.1 hypothetical protein Verru16b_03049 [Lacunisphaera limnophila]